MKEIASLKPMSLPSCVNKTGQNRYILLLTACFDPGAFSEGLARQDPEIRIQDYLESFNFWSALADQRIGGIVICENTNADLSRFRAYADQSMVPIELLSFDGNRKPEDVHYGYAELGIIDYAVENSRLIAEHDYFIKITGRLRFPQISKLLDRVDFDFDAIVDHRRRYKKESGFPSRARTQVMLFRAAFYRSNLLGVRDEMIGRCSHIEEFLAEKLNCQLSYSGVLCRFPIEMIPVGMTGWRGESYRSPRNYSKALLRAFMRKLFPNTWL